LAQFILSNKPDILVEIGVFGGKSLIPMGIALKHLGKGIAYGIDPWKKEPTLEGEQNVDNRDWWSSVDLHDIHKGAVEGIWNNGLDNHVALIRSTSEACHGLFSNIDLLHIDGNHSELVSVRDVRLYLPRVAVGGSIWFDDCEWPSTKQAQAILESHCEESFKVEKDGRICRVFQKH
jgi:predicted O-methyltransferase YrrM